MVTNQIKSSKSSVAIQILNRPLRVNIVETGRLPHKHSVEIISDQ